MRTPADENASASEKDSGPALLPPPVNPHKSVLRSIAALDAVEETTPGQRGPRVEPTITIDATAQESASEKPKAPPQESSGAARKPAEPVQPLRANAFRPNASLPAGAKGGKRSAWTLRAASVAALLGVGWLIGGQIVEGRIPFIGAGETTTKLSPLEQMKLDLQKVTAETASLRERLAKVETPEYRARQSAEVDALKKSLADLTRRLEQARNAQMAAITEVGARLDRVKLDEGKNREEMVERIARLEKGLTDGRPVASITPLPQPPNTIVPRNAAANQPPPPVEANQERKPNALAGFVLREVYNGMALIEGRRGYIEVYPGSNIPGVGRVQQIVRRNGAWVVVTSNGVIGPGNE